MTQAFTSVGPVTRLTNVQLVTIMNSPQPTLRAEPHKAIRQVVAIVPDLVHPVGTFAQSAGVLIPKPEA